MSAAIGSSGLTAHYEELRQQALSRPAERIPAPGLALFLRQGMTTWMRAGSPCMHKADGKTAPPDTAPPCSVDFRAQIATRLAGIILRRELEATKCK